MAQARLIFRGVTEVNRKITDHIKDIEGVARSIMDNNFIQGEGFAKEKAPWTDRTGNARNSIQAIDGSVGNYLAFWLTIGVEYGIWLELANQGKYRILLPTFEITSAKVQRDLAKVGLKVKITGSETM